MGAAVESPDVVKKLDDAQLRTFDHDYVSPGLFAFIEDALRRDFPTGTFSFLDVGGGMGFFADRVLARFPSAHATVVDNAESLLSKNVPDPRKRLILASATDLGACCAPGSFDVVFFNLSLHHFVTAGYERTCATQAAAVRSACALLAPGGRMCVVENPYDGLFLDGLPSRLVFALTSSTRLAPLVKRLGANTAGCGVCFRSTKNWSRLFGAAQLRQLAACAEPPGRPYSLAAKARFALLTMRQPLQRTAYWLSRT